MLKLSIYGQRPQMPITCGSFEAQATGRPPWHLQPQPSRPAVRLRRRVAPAPTDFCRCRRSNGTRRSRARPRTLYARVAQRRAGGRVAVLRALREGDQRAQARAQRRDPGAQLPDAGNLQLRRRFRRRQPAARPRGDQGRCRHHRAVRRALHGRDREDPESRQDGADPRQPRRLLARRLDHRRRRAPAARALSRACRSSPTSTRRPR